MQHYTDEEVAESKRPRILKLARIGHHEPVEYLWAGGTIAPDHRVIVRRLYEPPGPPVDLCLRRGHLVPAPVRERAHTRGKHDPAGLAHWQLSRDSWQEMKRCARVQGNPVRSPRKAPTRPSVAKAHPKQTGFGW